MIGYGPEDNHFVCELTYNYGISTYQMGQYVMNYMNKLYAYSNLISKCLSPKLCVFRH